MAGQLGWHDPRGGISTCPIFGLSSEPSGSRATTLRMRAKLLALLAWAACVSGTDYAAICNYSRWEYRPPANCDEDCQQMVKFLTTRRRKAAWNNYYADVSNYVSSELAGDTPLQIVEVGTAFGGLANHLLSKLTTAVVTAVDPFLAGYDEKDGQSNFMKAAATQQNLSPQGLSDLWARGMVSELTTAHGCRYRLIHKKSLDGVVAFANASLDVAFIDGLHTYEGIVDDLVSWLPKVKPNGGAVVFNDYGKKVFPGVKKAVDLLVQKLGTSFTYLHTERKQNVAVKLSTTAAAVAAAVSAVRETSPATSRRRLQRDDGVRVTLPCVDGSVDVSKAEAAVVARKLLRGTAALPAATLRTIVSTLRS